MTEALAPYRVVELGGGVAGAYCGKLFADFGARVRKIEEPQGDPLRSAEPAYFAWLNTHKDSVVAAPADLADTAFTARWLADCDVLIDARPRSQWQAGALAHERLRQAFPRLVIAAISWFGESGPYADYRASDAACWAWAGLAQLVGPREGPPALMPGYAAQLTGGLSAFTAAMAALIGRGEAAGRRMSLSIHEACVALAEYQVALGPTGMPMQRLGLNRFAPTYPLGIFECKTGWLGVTIVTPAQWRAFCVLFGMQEAAGNAAYLSNVARLRDADALESQFAPQLRARTAEEWFEQGRRHFLPFVVVPTLPELLAQPIYREREVFASVDSDGDGVQAQAPVLPQRLSRTPPRPGGTAPALGAVRPERETRMCPGTPPPQQQPRGLPLAGLRILDLTMGWAGPLVTRQLADLGAEVIKIEACQYPDWWRGTDFSPQAVADQLYEQRPPFLMMNRNKRGITLDLTQPRGTQIFHQLLRGAHAVVENYSSGVMRKLGLGYATLAQTNPALVMMSMPAFGGGSAWSDVRAYGSTLEHASGLPTLVGEPAWPPTSAHLAFGDPVGGLNATAALLVALDHQRRTGEGQHIGMSQVECILPLVTHALVRCTPGGPPPVRRGNAHPVDAPHGCYPCAGEDEWVFIGIQDDAQWPRLCQVAQLAELGVESALQRAEGRRAEAARIDTALAGWTRQRGARAAVAALQAAGLCSAQLLSPFALPQDPQLRARGFWQSVARAIAGSDQPQPSLPFREGAAPYAVERPAPTLGQDNDAVLGDLLGLTESERAALRADGIVGEVALPAQARRARAAQT